MLTRTRPLGVTIISILLFIQGILALLGAILLFTAGGASAVHGHVALSTIVTLGAIVALVLAVLTLFLAWGLWTLRTWAFWSVVVIECINIVNGILSWTQTQQNLLPLLASIAVPVIVLLYMLLDQNVRAAFRT